MASAAGLHRWGVPVSRLCAGVRDSIARELESRCAATEVVRA
eukprot:SAG22_NODE_8561_length_645_cov_1.067766_1_plen_41_part_10